MTRATKASVCLLWMLCAASAHAQSALPSPLRAVAFDQKLNEQVPLDLPYRDEDGKDVRLRDYFDGKPVILVLAYYRCPMLCDQVLNGLVRAMLDMPFDAGKEFNVLTVSFDPRETAELAAAKKRNYLERYGRPGAAHGWHFLTGDASSIKALTDAVGFRYVYDEKNDQYAHASGIMLLTPTGRLSRYLYDVRFSPRDLRLGLVEAADQKIGSPVDQVLLYCFHYDPVEGKYGPTIINFVRLAGAFTLVGVAIFAFVLWRREHHASTPSAANIAAAR